MNSIMREKWTAGSDGRKEKESGEDETRNNDGCGIDNSAVMVAMVCGMVLSFILLAILLAIIGMKWYTHCLIMLTTFLISPLSLSLCSRRYFTCSGFCFSSLVTSTTTCKSIHFS